MQNNAHMEEKAKRLKRFQDNPPCEIVGTLLNSIANFFNNEISDTVKEGNPQTSLLFLGIHAVALTVSEGLFNKNGPAGYKLFLEKFIDGTTPDTQFSSISDMIHDWRNILAHQWIGLTGHKVDYDYTMSFGWEVRNNIIYVNPRIYLGHYLAAFGRDGKIWEWEKHLTSVEQEAAKQRLLKKYKNN